MSKKEMNAVVDSESEQQKTDASGRPEPHQKFFEEALASFRILKRNHQSFFDANPKEFRALLDKAQSRVLRLTPGPKPDPAIAKSARAVASGAATIDEEFERQHSKLGTTNEALYDMARESYRTKVNAYIRRHPFLKRKRDLRRQRDARKTQ